MRIPFYYFPKTSPAQEMLRELQLPFPLGVSSLSSIDDRIKTIKLPFKSNKASSTSADEDIELFVSLLPKYYP
jgi:hypothetical protein